MFEQLTEDIPRTPHERLCMCGRPAVTVFVFGGNPKPGEPEPVRTPHCGNGTWPPANPGRRDVMGSLERAFLAGALVLRSAAGPDLTRCASRYELRSSETTREIARCDHPDGHPGQHSVGALYWDDTR